LDVNERVENLTNNKFHKRIISRIEARGKFDIGTAFINLIFCKNNWCNLRNITLFLDFLPKMNSYRNNINRKKYGKAIFESEIVIKKAMKLLPQNYFRKEKEKGNSTDNIK